MSAAANVTGCQHLFITVVDAAGFQNPATCGRRDGATFTDLCQNYIQERLHDLYRQSAISSVMGLWMKVSFHYVLKIDAFVKLIVSHFHIGVL